MTPAHRMTALGIALAWLFAPAAASPALGQPQPGGGPPPFDDSGPQGFGPQGGPPPQVFMACAGLTDGAECAFPVPGARIQGHCHVLPDGRLACLPPEGPRPPGARRGEVAPLLRQPSPPERAPQPSPAERVVAAPAPWKESPSAPGLAPARTALAQAAAGQPQAAAPARPAAETTAAPRPSEGKGAPGSGPPPFVPPLILIAAGADLFALYQRLMRKAPPAAAPGVPAPPAPAAAQAAVPAGPTGGLLIAKSYEIRREIGAGGMGMVYEAFDLSLDRRVALKKMRPEIGVNARARERFVAEAKTVAKLQHPGIVAIHAILEDGGDLYLAFEYVDGETLDDMIGRQIRLLPEQALAILGDVASAVDYAHSRRVIHRDLKPSNIMVDVHGRAKVMDFGIAHEAKITVSRLTSTEAYGTTAYMPPEQELGQAVRESDVYAFAAVTYEALTGGIPFPGPDFHLQKMELAFQRPSAARLPGALDAVFERALHPEPKKRYPTTAEFVKTIQAVLAAR